MRALCGQPLDRGHRAATDRLDRRLAREHRASVDVHRARAALGSATPVLGAGKLQPLAQYPQQACTVRNIDADRPPVHAEVDRHVALLLPVLEVVEGSLETPDGRDDVPKRQTCQASAGCDSPGVARRNTMAP